MNLTDYIEELRKIRAAKGDLQVHTIRGWDAMLAPAPQVGYYKIKHGRERKDAFWNEILDKEEDKGQEIVRV